MENSKLVIIKWNQTVYDEFNYKFGSAIKQKLRK